ncbi:MAG: hypothetical protein G3M70_06575 [Candidatus Nitronauta litoralis]|uniref:Bacterial Pleckstrin homology domain-containing protein n=1 Tax=Candidatus Nitronauta litoralis TaxID=2705533 RepID=A0A7T0BW58_9BACT|nr:MAG: hypothetical protein G3M70_06575 [Candidatus Nitronauta litoralis]
MLFKIVSAENLWWLYLVFVAGALAMALGYVSMARQAKDPSASKKWLLKIRFILPLCTIGMLLATWLVYKQETATLEIRKDSLLIHAGWYSQEIPKSRLRLDEARFINLKEEHQLQPVIRTNGTGAPGLSAGWFRLRNGDKAFLLVTRKNNVLYLPTQDYILLLSLKEPVKFLDALILN